MLAYKISEERWVTVDPSMVRTHHTMTREERVDKKITYNNCGHTYDPVTLNYITMYVYADGHLSFEETDYVSFECLGRMRFELSQECDCELLYKNGEFDFIINSLWRGSYLDEYKYTYKFAKKANARRIGCGYNNESEIRAFTDTHIKDERSVNNVCWGCKEARKRTRNIVSHGLQAFSGMRNLKNTLRNIDNIINNPQWEVCCTSQNIFLGEIGILGQGDINTYFPIDVCSLYNEDGSRRISRCGINRLKEYVNLVKQGKSIEDMQYKHDEYWVSSLTPVALWVTRNQIKTMVAEDTIFGDNNIQILKQTAKKYNVPIIVVNNKNWLDNGGKGEILGTINWNINHDNVDDEMLSKVTPEVVHKLINAKKCTLDIVAKLDKGYIFSGDFQYSLSQEKVRQIKSQIMQRKQKNNNLIEYSQVFKAVRAAFKEREAMTIEDLKQIINVMVHNGYLGFNRTSNDYITSFFIKK